MPACAQPRWTFHPYKNPESVSDDRIRDVLLGQDGTLWVATWGSGLIALRARGWETFDEQSGFPSDWVRCLAKGEGDDIWVGTTQGVVRMRGSQVHRLRSEDRAHGERDEVESILQLEDGRLWWGTEKGEILSVDPTEGEGNLPLSAMQPEVIAGKDITGGGQVFALCQREDESVWASFAWRGIGRYSDGAWEDIPVPLSPGDIVQLLHEDIDGTLYAGVGSKLLKWNGTSWEFPDWGSDSPTELATSPEGEFYVANKRGIRVHTARGWESLEFPLSLGFPTVSSMAFGKDGSLWLGTYEGLVRGSVVPWQNLSQRSVEKDLQSLSLAAGPEGRLYAVGVDGVLQRKEDSGWEPVPVEPECRFEKPLWMVSDGEDRFYILSEKRIEVFSLGRGKVIDLIPLPADLKWGRRLKLMEDGTLWVLGTEDAVAFRDQKEVFRSNDSDPSKGRAEEVVELGGREILVCFEGGGLILDGATQTPLVSRYPEFQDEHLKSCVRLANGEVWIGTYGGGILKIADERVERIQLDQGGLLSNHISRIFQASDGTLWVAYRRKGTSSYRDGHWVHFSHVHGLPNRSVLQILEDPEGSIWMVDSSFSIYRYQFDLEGPETFIRTAPEEFSYRQAGTFTFGGRDAWNRTPTSNLEYSWRVTSQSGLSLSTSWSPFKRETTGFVTDLPAGDYVLEVRAADEDRNVDATPAVAGFIITPPLWLSPAFLYPLAGVSMVALALLLTVLRKNTALKESEEALRKQVDFEGLVASFSRQFVNIDPTRIDDEIVRSLGKLGVAVGADRAFLLLIEENGDTFSLSHEWHEDRIASLSQSRAAFPALSFPNSFGLLLAEETIELSPGSRKNWTQAEERFFERTEGLSWILLAMEGEGRVQGGLCLGFSEFKRIWDEESMTLLRLAEEILANALERQRALRELRKKEDFLKQTQLISQVGGWEWDLETERISWTEEVFRIHELPFTFQPTVESVLAFYHPDSVAALKEALDKASRCGDPFDLDLEMRTALGNPLWVRAIGEAEWLEDKVVRVFGTFQNITSRIEAEQERQRFEEKMQQAQKLESLGVLTGGIAHDFNNILVGILGNASLALEDIPEDSPCRESLSEIEKASRRAAELIRQMLAYSGRGKFVIEKIEINQLVREMIDLVQASISKKAELHCRLGDDLPLTEGDATQIRQIVLNLLTNASEALEEKAGTIRITTGTRYCTPEDIRTPWLQDPPPPGNFVFVRVEDTGEGMPQEILGKIFDPFFSTKFTGRGLGLAAVLGIVRSHHGTLHVESEPGLGTRFEVLFPTCEGLAPISATSKNPRSSWRKGHGRILLVDDEASVRNVGKRILENAGFEVVLAVNGNQAVELFKNQPNGFHAVLLDLTMPGMDGYETFRVLRTLHPRIPILVSSGYDREEVLERFKGEEANGFVPKPYDPLELLETLKTVLDAWVSEETL